jgi:hypothetical protein
LKLFAGFKPDGFAGRDIGDFSSSRIASNSAFSRFYHEHPEAAQLDALSALEGVFHRFEQRLDGDLGLGLWNAGLVGYLIDYV